MIRVTFLGHSGFLAETDSALLLFDWHKGDLPALPPKPLLVFASHQHKDHFNPRIFALDDGTRTVHFFLGSDLVLTEHRRQRWNISPETAERCHVMNGGETVTVNNGQNKPVFETTPENAYSILIYSSPDLKDGAYTLWSGDTQIASGSDGSMGKPGMGFGGMERPEPPEGMEPPEGGKFPEDFEPPQGGMPPEGFTPPEGDMPPQKPDGTLPDKPGENPMGMQKK